MQLALESRDRLVAIKQELEVARQVQDSVQPKAAAGPARLIKSVP